MNERVLRDNLELAFTGARDPERDLRLELRALCGGVAQILDIFFLSLAAVATVVMFFFDPRSNSYELLLAMHFSWQNLFAGIECWILWAISLWSLGLYGARYHHSIKQLFKLLVVGSVFCSIVLSTFLYLRHPMVNVLRPFGFFFLVGGASLTIERLGILAYTRYIKPLYRIPRRALIVGSGRRARQLLGDLAHNEDYKYEVLGFIDSESQLGSNNLDLDLVGSMDDLEQILMRQNVDEVFIALPVRSQYDQIVKAIGICECAGVQSQYLADLFPTRVAKRRVSEGENADRVTLHMVHSDSRRFIKRTLDVFGALFGLTVLSPVFLAVAIAVKLSSSGPIFFSQTRYGLNKRKFQMHKFRSMVVNAEALQAKLEHLNEANGAVFKIKNDPRITAVGRFIRRTSLDELPQLWNVLVGEMSLVGPRPLPMRDVNLIVEPSQMRRFSVKPGMTGLWQVSGRSDTSFDSWITLDLEYIDHWSPFMDVHILCRTVNAVVRGTGAS